MLSFYPPILEKSTSKILWGAFWGDLEAIIPYAVGERVG
jgi:hypothetical protein